MIVHVGTCRPEHRGFPARVRNAEGHPAQDGRKGARHRSWFWRVNSRVW